MKKYPVGYTQGAFDMFHIGHLNLINHARALCDRLVVGVNSDRLIREYKGKSAVINEAERAEIVRNLRAVDECEVVDTLDKVAAWKRWRFDAIFIGDDWKGTPRWEKTRIDLAAFGADLVYLPRTEGVSSTDLAAVIKKILDDSNPA